MGVKRPFDEEFQESSFKQAKQFEPDNVWNSVTKEFPSNDVTETAYDQGEAGGNVDKFQLLKDFDVEDSHVTSSMADKELESSAPLSWVTSSSSEEDAGSGHYFPPSFFAEFFPFNFHRRTVHQLEDGYSSQMNLSPRKQIPVGPEYQAEIPPWNPDGINNENDQRVGRCVISPCVSEDLAQDEIKIGQGREECNCLDIGSVRCVQQHINEAREKLKEAIGDERFSDLGFYDMGEEVACKWTEEDESIFHEVVYSNPVSLGKNFWKELPLVFPSRTMKDLVSYYFNVFILHRRAVQNRSNSLDIDSDDDEWQGNGRSFFGRVDDDDDFAVESFGHHDFQAASEDDIHYDDRDDGDDDDDSDNSDDDGDGEPGDDVAGRVDGGDDTDWDYMRGPFSKSPVSQMQNDTSTDSVLKMGDPSDTRKENTVLEDSDTSCESQLGSCVSSGNDSGKSTLRDDLTGYLTGESYDSNEGLDSGFFLDHGDAKVWDESRSTGFARNVDFLPTCSMIEEIFGPFSSKRN